MIHRLPTYIKYDVSAYDTNGHQCTEMKHAQIIKVPNTTTKTVQSVYTNPVCIVDTNTHIPCHSTART